MSLSQSFSFKVNKPDKAEWNQIKKYSTWFAEPKLDGCRLFYKDGKLIRDNGLIKNVQYPEVINTISKLPDGIVLDGELCNLTSPYTADFNKLQHRINLKDKIKINLLSKAEPATFVAFDILRHEGNDLTKLPYLERIKILVSVLHKHLEKTDFDRVTQMQQYSPAELSEVITKYQMEGMVLKNPDSVYNSQWLKMKAEYEIDCKVVGYTSETRMISALELEDLKGNYVGKVNYQKEQTEEMAKKIIGMIAVVNYNRKTKDGKLVFPVLKELRSK